MESRATPFRGWGLAAYLVAGIITLGIAYFLVRAPFQVSDNVENLLNVQARSAWELFSAYSWTGAYLRPFLWLTINAVFEASAGHYVVAFKAFHVLQVALLLWLVVRVLAVHTFADFVCVPVALTLLVGFHTFRGLIVEAYPVNTYLTVLVCLAGAVNLSAARPRLLVDLAALALFVFAALTLETGLLIWVALAAGYLAGFRGVSPAGLALTTAALAGYMIFRFVVADVGVPGFEVPTGFGTTILEPQELDARFGENPWPIRFYNVASSVLTVLFAEPRRGSFELVRQWLANDLSWGTLLSVGATSATTLVVALFALGSCARWRRGDVTPGDRLVIVSGAVLLGNAAMSFSYNKDEIMSPAGLMYAMVAYSALTGLAVRGHRLSRPGWSSVAAVPLCILSFAWCLRAVDLPFNIQLAAVRNQTDWVRVDDWMRANEIRRKRPDAEPFIRALQREALATHVPNPFLHYRWWDRYSDH